MCAVALRPSARASQVVVLSDGRKAPFPDFIGPCDPTLQEDAPRRGEWLYEIKADGYRAQVHRNGGKTIVYSRNGLDWTSQFAPIAKATKELEARSAVIDGEAVVYGTAGIPDFQALRRELGNPQSKRVRFLA